MTTTDPDPAPAPPPAPASAPASAPAPAATPAATGLRERKKARTRALIREQALRLFRAQGYHETTVEQIAAAAEVSPATFFRYFPTKEDVVLVDDFRLVTLSIFEAQPPELGPAAAYRTAIAATYGSLTPAEQQAFVASAKLKMSIPELRARGIDELARGIDDLAAAIARREGRPAADVATRSTAGAIIGVVISATAAWHVGAQGCGAGAPVDVDLRAVFERIDEALRCLEAGLPPG